MSAVILTLSTPLYALGDDHNAFSFPGILPGDYRLYVWIEGVPQSFLQGMSQTLHFSSRAVDLGTMAAPIVRPGGSTHADKSGNPCNANPESTY